MPKTSFKLDKTDPMYLKVSAAVPRLWNAIGMDLEEAMESSGGGRMTNKGVIESCLDANRMVYMLGKDYEDADKWVTEVAKAGVFNKLLTALSQEHRLV